MTDRNEIFGIISMDDENGKSVTIKLEGVEAKGQAGRVAAKGVVRRNPREGRRKYGYESIKGNEFSAANGHLIYKEQILDRENNFYKKLVVDEDTGETLRDVEHKLSEHKERGSAKQNKKSNN